MTQNLTTERPRVVVGVDRSPTAVAAMKWAATYAQSIGGTLEFVAAWRLNTATYGWTYLSDTSEETRQIAVQGLEAAVDEVFGGTRPADSELVVEEGHPAQVLVDAAKGASCVVVGSRGHAGLAGVVLGSVSSAVAAHASCPVVVVHEDD